MSDPHKLKEYEAFQMLTDGAERAISGAKLMSALRPDQRYAWEKMAEAWGVTREACFRLAGESVGKQ